MKKGVDYIGVNVSYYCHDGEGNFVMHLRNEKCRDEHHCWDFGGGGVEFGETAEEAVCREIKEEFGADVMDLEQIGVREVLREHDNKKTHWISFQYLVKVNKEMVHNAEPEKHDDIGWFRLDKLPSPLHSQIMCELEKFKEFLK